MSQRVATSTILGRAIQYKYHDPKAVYNARDIITDMNKQFGLDWTYWKAHRAKLKALKMVRGDPTESYAEIPRYLHMLTQSNPGSIVNLQKTVDGHFQYAFVALNSSIQGWVNCRPVVIVDGSFLKAAYHGTFLTASCQDAGDLPHYACMWHLWKNIKENFRRNQLQLREIYYAMARAYTVQDFDYYMAEVNRIDHRVKTYLYEIGYSKWSRAHSTSNRTMTMISNIAKSLNSATKDARDLPATRLLEEMCKLIEKWNYDKSKEALYTNTKLTAKYESILADNLEIALHMMVRPSSDYLHTVTHMGKTFIVCIKAKTCTCQQFQLDELPCPHDLAVLHKKGLDGDDYSSLCYTKENMMKTYDISVHPMPNESTWDLPQEVAEEILLHPIVTDKMFVVD
ncbi:hypothetical protein KY290_007696 [Solanum tuberosum]|uniref:SWIM-type domain-containing protein n=1 Tax=Solanum tuberosum TaxID=4113 RepID=A0ABQ7W6S6_SOLTU|nr:hypothetical protein KY290_007696 [Solanum tuberosum]